MIEVNLRELKESGPVVQKAYLKHFSSKFDIEKEDLNVNRLVVGTINIEPGEFCLNNFTTTPKKFTFTVNGERVSINIEGLKSHYLYLTREGEQLTFLGIKK